MGQKIHPSGFRLSVSRNWSSRWYASNRDFAGMLAEDIKVRDYLKQSSRTLRFARADRAPAKNARITIFSARPGVVIGKKGEDIENLKRDLGKQLGVPAVNIEEVRKPKSMPIDCRQHHPAARKAHHVPPRHEACHAERHASGRPGHQDHVLWSFERY